MRAGKREASAKFSGSERVEIKRPKSLAAKLLSMGALATVGMLDAGGVADKVRGCRCLDFQSGSGDPGG